MRVMRHFGWLVACAIVGYFAFLAGVIHATAVPNDALSAALGFSGALIGTIGAVGSVLLVARYERRKNLEPVALLVLQRTERDRKAVTSLMTDWIDVNRKGSALFSMAMRAETISKAWLGHSDELQRECSQLSRCIGPYFQLSTAMHRLTSRAEDLHQKDVYDAIIAERKAGTPFHQCRHGRRLTTALEEVTAALVALLNGAGKYT